MNNRIGEGHMDLLEEGAVHQAMSQGTIEHGAKTSEEAQLATDRPQTNDRRKIHMRLGDVIPGTGVMRVKKKQSQRFGQEGKSRALIRGNDTQAGQLRDATSMATAFEPLSRSFETFLTRLSGTNERNEKSRSVFKKPRCYKKESDDCIDTWIEVMKLHFEEEDVSERQECSALTSNLEGTALNCVMAKKQYQRDTAEKIFKILLNRFGSEVQGH